MRRLPVVLTEPAIVDLNQIVDYIVEASGNRQTAIRYIRRIKARCKRIGDVPRGGRKREDLLRGMRMVPFERSAAICYLIESDRC